MPIKYLSLLLLPLWINLPGCSTEPAVIPETGPDTMSVYQQHIGSTSSSVKMFREVQNERADLAGYTRDSENEIRNLFPKLPNPELVMFVFPHMSEKNRPVPGYSTAFSMYEKDEYAMPGEIAP